MENQQTFFDFAAEVGLTKHIGGIEATEGLIKLCHIVRDSYVLDVGCGVGATPCYLAKVHGCRVVGVDISKKMVARSWERAAREKVADRVEFRVANAQDLPFEDNLFDAVITESVTAFPEDKQKAVDEYKRVTKPGGYVGLNETTWLKIPPPSEIVAWVEQDVGATVKPLSSDAWTELLEVAGLAEITVKIFAIHTQDKAKGILQRYGLGGMLGVMGRMMLLYARSSDYRKFVKGVRRSGVIPENLEEYFGYGLFVGRKWRKKVRMSAKYRARISNAPLWIGLSCMVVLLAACSSQYPETCPSSTPIGLLDADEIAMDDSLPFRFPLEASTVDGTRFFGWFGVSNECTPNITDCYEYSIRQYHAAEDYKRPAGMPVYAMADGRTSFSGRAGGYGWLILIDHPQANLYSLYGHLSPSRWKLESGIDVKRGDLIAYLGDSDENGGSVEEPLEPHLHFGIRAGQVVDYPTRGEWRYMAGWIRFCPQDLGWLQPSAVIASQEIPAGGFSQPRVDFLTRWGLELMITSTYTIFGAVMITFAIKRKLRIFAIAPGGLLIVAGIILHNIGILTSYVLLATGKVFAALGIFLIIGRYTRKQPGYS